MLKILQHNVISDNLKKLVTKNVAFEVNVSIYFEMFPSRVLHRNDSFRNPICFYQVKLLLCKNIFAFWSRVSRRMNMLQVKKNFQSSNLFVLDTVVLVGEVLTPTSNVKKTQRHFDVKWRFQNFIRVGDPDRSFG